MNKMKRRGIALLLILALSVTAVGVNSKQAEAGVVSWLAKKVIKSKVTKVVVDKAANTVKSAYSKKQKNFKVSTKSRKIYVKKTVKLKPLLCYGNTISWSSSDKTVATVSADGVVKGKKAGVATITAVPSISQIVSKIKITVKAYPTINRKKTMTVGDSAAIYIKNAAEVSSDNTACVKASLKSTGQVKLIAEAAGTCKVTVIKKNTQKVVITVKVKEKKVEPTPEPEKTPKPTKEPEPTKTPKPTETPEVTKEPVPTETPEPTGIPEFTEMPEVTETPEPTETPASEEDEFSMRF